MTKRALCVGINDYPGTNSDLSGCVNDARDWAAALRARGYAIQMLLNGEATRAGIERELKALLLGATKGDQLVFTFSGHGSWLPDRSGDEPDGRDEMLCPYDVHSGQYLMDDTLDEIFGERKAGVQLVCAFDSCHSGTVTRWAPAPLTDVRVPTPRFLPPLLFLPPDEAVARRVEQAATKPLRPALVKFPALLLAGCKDTEYSYDAWFNGRSNGAMTYVALDALQQGPGTPRDWLRAIRQQLPSRDYPQTPQLYGSPTAKGSWMI